MRVVLVALFCFAAPLAGISILHHFYPNDDAPDWLMGTATIGALFVAITLSMHLFNKPKRRKNLLGKLKKEQLEALKQKGLVREVNYTANRSFRVEEYEDEGSHYFIELEDKTVLFLSGQYLYDYEPYNDEPGESQDRIFPCSEFSIHWYVADNEFYHLQCNGKAMAPEVIYPFFSKADFNADLIPDPNTLIVDRSYEELRRWRERALETS